MSGCVFTVFVFRLEEIVSISAIRESSNQQFDVIWFNFHHFSVDGCEMSLSGPGFEKRLGNPEAEPRHLSPAAAQSQETVAKIWGRSFQGAGLIGASSRSGVVWPGFS